MEGGVGRYGGGSQAKGKAGVYHYLSIANLSENAFTEIRNFVNQRFEESVNDEVYARKRQNLDNLWKPTWFRHICQPEKAVERAKAVLKARRRTDLELMADFGYEPQVFTIWKFNGRDERFGVEHPGNIPAGILFNVLYYWSEQGDLVIDPMAGGGVTVDVCRVMKRRCLAWDVHPVRDDIGRHDAVEPWPVVGGPADRSRKGPGGLTPGPFCFSGPV